MIRKRVAVLISGRGSNLAALIKAAQENDYPGEIELVVSDRRDAAGTKVARAAGIATSVVEHSEFGADRQAFERTLQSRLEAHRIDIVCLAGFMRLLSPWFVELWRGRMLNIHPSLLPAFKGLHTHERALAAGVKIHGASVHFVVAEMDSGPIVVQGAVPVKDDDDAATLAERVLAVEHRIYPLALRLLCMDKLRIVEGRCSTDGAGAGELELIAPQMQEE